MHSSDISYETEQSEAEEPSDDSDVVYSCGTSASKESGSGSSERSSHLTHESVESREEENNFEASDYGTESEDNTEGVVG